MKKAYELYLSLVVSGDRYSPSEIDEILGVFSTKAFRAGDKKPPKYLTEYSENKWVYEKVSAQEVEPNEAMSMLIKDFLDKESELHVLSAHMKIKFFFAIYKKDYYPGIIFDPANLRFLSRVDAGLELDLY